MTRHFADPFERRTLQAASVPSEIRLIEATAEPVDIQAAADGDDGKPRLRRFTATAYNGGPMVPRGFDRPVVVDLSGVRVASGNRPILKDHDQAQIVGHTTAIKVGDRRISATGIISGTGPAAAEVLANADNGFPWRLSIGAAIGRIVAVDEGERVTVNGRTFKGPIYVARAITLQEITFCAIGADNSTSAAIAATSYQRGNSMDFEAWLTAQGFDPNELSDAQTKTLRAAYDAEQADADPPTDPPADPPADVRASGDPAPPAAPPADPIGDLAAAGADEVDRQREIRDLCGDEHTDIAATAIRERWTTERTELQILRASRPTGPAIHNHGNGEGRTPAVLACALALDQGMEENLVAEGETEQTMNQALTANMRGYGLKALFYDALRAHGISFHPGQFGNEEIRNVLRTDPGLHAASGFSTLSVSGILGNVANKTLRAAYRTVDDVASRISDSISVPDFKTTTSYMLTSTGELQEVGPSGELKHGQLGEDSYTNQAVTRGLMLGLNRPQIINDDMGAFLKIPRTLGRKAALSLQKVTFTTLLGNAGSFFSSGNKNLLTGAGSALSIAALATAAKTFAEQTDQAGDPISVTPAILLTPPALMVTAESIYKKETVNETTTANKKSPADNPHAGKYRPEMSPYLSNENITGYSDSKWYLFADPADVAALEIAYLQGKKAPTIESAEAAFNVLGIQFRIYFDFGVALADPRGAQRNDGA